jgi:hypothetical protein
MKIKSLLCCLAVCSLSGIAHAQTTIIELTGATAFRSAAVTSINAAFVAGGPFAYGWANTTSSGSATTFNSSSMHIWRGTFPGIPGTTVIRTSWNGSVEGIRAVAVPGVDPVTGDQNNPLYLKESILGAPGTETTVRFHSDPNGPGAPVNAQNYERAESDFSFSDVAQSATPVSGLSLAGGPVGVVVFTMIANKTWSDDKLAATPLSGRMPTGITAQQFRSMAQRGFVPLSFFTGNAADTSRVFLTGRNDGSGTRTSYLSETGVGAATPIKQYVGYDRSQAANLPSIFLVPANGGFDAQGVARPEYRSTVWGNTLDGNGGHVSSGDVRTDLPKTTASTAVYEFVDLDESGTITANEAQIQFPASKLYMISWVTYNDARGARGSGLASARNAEILGYEGVRLEGLAGDNPPTNLTGEDLAKVANGAYTAWNFQQLYYVASRPGANTVFTELSTRLNDPAVIGTAGLPLGAMNVDRTVDGGVILPE